jgi:hypothetical protein
MAAFLFSFGVTLITGAVLKLAAVISSKRVRWVHCLAYGAAMALLSLLVQGVWSWIGSAPPLWLGVLLGMAGHLSIGSWFLRSRLKDRAGAPQGIAAAARVMIIFFALLGVMAGSLFALSAVLRESYLQ